MGGIFSSYHPNSVLMRNEFSSYESEEGCLGGDFLHMDNPQKKLINNAIHTIRFS